MSLVQEKYLSIFIDQALVESLLFADYSDLSGRDQATDGREKTRFPTVGLSYEAHDFFFVLFNAAVEQTNEIFAKVRYFQLTEAIF